MCVLFSRPDTVPSLQDNGDDVFVHQTSIQGEGFRTLAEGDKVEFEIIKDQKGYKATNVVKL